jgi:hypothetical protein
MPELETLTRTRDGSTGTTSPDDPDRADTDGPPGTAEAATTLDVAGANVAVSGDPTDAEAAALAAVLTEHLRAEAAEADGDEEPRYAVDPWCLAGRLGRRSRSGVPTACPSGREWKVTGRSATW